MISHVEYKRRKNTQKQNRLVATSMKLKMLYCVFENFIRVDAKSFSSQEKLCTSNYAM